MDTSFCQCWEGDEKSKHCRVCTVPGEPCYELWKMVCQLASDQFVFTNKIRGKAFGNKYRLESPQGEVCYLQMLQGKGSRFQLPMEDFLYVTKTGKGGINQTPSGTRQYPFVNLLLEIIATDPEGEYAIKTVRKDPKDLAESFPSINRPLRIDLTKLNKDGESTDALPKPEQHSSVEKGTCPRCGSSLAWHTARKTGERYRGCTNYPECKYNDRSY